MGKKKAVVKEEVSPVLSLEVVNAKFTKLKELRAKIIGLKSLYVEHDTLMRELLPLFITQDKDSFLIAREITIGTHTYRFSPAFYSEKEGLRSKAWKSTAFETGTIE
jgi:hypothetical protein